MSNQLADSFNGFGLRLFKELPKGNCFFSPMSIAIALSALIPGAKGRTQEELLSLLKLDPSSLDELGENARTLFESLETGEEAALKLHLGNALFAEKGFPISPSYRQILEEYYSSEMFSVDFGRAEETAEQINKWASMKTRGMINQLVDPDSLTRDLVFILVNAVYFKAFWASRFDKKQTKQQPFYVSSEPRRLANGPHSVQVDMMRQTNRFLYMEIPKLGLQILDFQYKDTTASMKILLPAEGRLAALEEWLSVESLTKIRHSMTRVEVNLELPRFEMNLGRSLVKDLKALGVKAMFGDSADFGNLTDHPLGVFISRVIHQARVRVDEEGTEAAAATAVYGMLLGLPPDPISFIVNRPFIFLIHDRRTGVILFIGRVVNPNQQPASSEQ